MSAHFNTNQEQTSAVFTSTGITGVPGQEIGVAQIREYIAEHADDEAVRRIASECDATLRDRDENPNGNLSGIMQACTDLCALQGMNIA